MINSLMIFSFLTILFGSLKYFTRNENTLQSILTLLYLLTVMTMQFYVNFDYIKQKCGGKGDYSTAFINTMLPFIFIFMIVYFILKALPSWKSPFSNTIGYLITRLFGVRDILFKILKPHNGVINSDVKQGINASLLNSLTKIYEDPSLLINSLTPDNMRDFTEKSSELFNENASVYFDKLYDIVIIKDIVAEYIWYFLSGVLATAYSISSIAALKCNISASDMIKMHRIHVDKHKANVEQNDPSNKKVYNIAE
jgi:hypothetical protein